MSSGYAPIGAVITTDEIQSTFTNEGFRHGFTFGRLPISCAIGYAVLEYMTKHNLIAKAAERGKHLLKQLNTLQGHPSVGDVRGKGLLAGIEFVKNKETKEPFNPAMNFSYKLQEILLQKGLSIYPIHAFLDGVRGDHIQIAPPFIVTPSQIDEIIAILDRSFDEIEKK
jgi:adenosylmethionine-8-amino-7-oxononanoate aminotransferase